MDWATVASVGITGAVGIAGVAGTITAAKIAGRSARESAQLSIGAESARARLADKRQVYARAIAALDAAAWAAHWAGQVRGAAQSSQVSTEDAEALREAAEDLRQAAEALTRAIATLMPAFDALSELRLIAPRPVAELANHAWNIVLGLREGGTDLPNFSDARNTLFEALRADLENEARAVQDVTPSSYCVVSA